MKTLKQVRAGRLVMVDLYTTPDAGHRERVRAPKCKSSSEKRKKLNDKSARIRLEQILAANFDDGDILLTCTFDEKHRPESREQAMRRARSFFTRLRAARKARGQPLRYIYVIEGCSPGGRPHIHAVVNDAGEDLREIKDKWRYGCKVKLQRLTFSRDYTYEDLVGDLTKEIRRFGRTQVWDHIWTSSKGLDTPEPELGIVPDSFDIAAPSGAEGIKLDHVVNRFGEFARIKYLMKAGDDAENIGLAAAVIDRLQDQMEGDLS